ncbi:MAG: CheR family methyltransferase [Alphaproteobacteria bacterium]
MSGKRPSRNATADPKANNPPDQQEIFPVVGIGASAGGLSACKKFLSTLPPDTGMAFILVQHLDPTHKSMMVDLLAGSTAMPVLQATHGMKVQANHFYVIPPGYYLAVQDGAMHLSLPGVRQGTRMPFDFLLKSLAEDYGSRVICIVLSGTGADGSVGLRAVSESGGLVIAQDPDDAAYDGMPRSAIATGLVQIVTPLAAIASALLKQGVQVDPESGKGDSPSADQNQSGLRGIIDLLRAETSHNFALYKTGTLERRILRRMGMAGCDGDFVRYTSLLQNHPAELDLLRKYLLIHVTGFFRDPDAFEFLAENVIPDLIANATPGQPLRIWIAGCSTGEETYSLAILFREKMREMNANIKLQIFASDIDKDAISQAREGLYPAAIASDISPARLARFFSLEDLGYRVLPELRDTILFAAQDLLADPPFSRLDLVSCRNLLIYLKPEAQAQVVSQFHFALRHGGILMLGSSETIGKEDDRFGVVSKPHRIYRHIGRRRPGEFGVALTTGDTTRPQIRPVSTPAPSRQEVLADLCQRLVLEKFAPAAILVNSNNECLYTLGPTDRYLHVAPGYPTHDALAMVRRDLRIKLRSAIQQAKQKNIRVMVEVGGDNRVGEPDRFSIAVEPIHNEGEDLLLIGFLDRPRQDPARKLPIPDEDLSRVAELERELDATRTELEGAIQNLENSSQEQKSINQEALSINEEYQSTNEELETSKEELQSLNEELTALNSQLHETLERQRTTTDDLQNILYSTNVATLFLDTNLCIRFFTPAAKKLLNIIAGDIGRPIADLSATASDPELQRDSRTVLGNHTVLECEVLFPDTTWYLRRILPYRTESAGVEGVVITFSDITERKIVAETLNAAMVRADRANMAKTRFLAAASHDLRQPLQTFALIQGILARTVQDAPAQKLIARLDETLGAMSGMLNALLDINEIEAGTLCAKKQDFPINILIERMRDEFGYHAKAKGLAFHTVPCGLIVHSDPRLLEQMIRNLLSNALKYTSSGKVLLGCRRRAETVRIEVLDTGIGIDKNQFSAIFEEYHQIGNDARERERGLGLGLAIVKRLGELLDHPLAVNSLPETGSVFAIDVPRVSDGAAVSETVRREKDIPPKAPATAATVLVVEDDPDVRDLLEFLLESEGYRTIAAATADDAMELTATDRPDIILADFNLPSGMNGLELVAAIQSREDTFIPAIMLTGDISTKTLRQFAQQKCHYFSKPIKSGALLESIASVLTAGSDIALSQDESKAKPGISDSPKVYVVDDDPAIREAIREILDMEGWAIESFSNCEDFLAAYRPSPNVCLLIDSRLPGMQGIELLQKLRAEGSNIPAIMITGNGDVGTAVQAMKAGARDFIEKPIGSNKLVKCIDRALAQSRDTAALSAWREKAADRVSNLTSRQRQIMDLVLAGHPSKNIATDLGISQRTVENHRAAIMKKTGTKSIPALARLASAAIDNLPEGPVTGPRQWNDQTADS